MMKNMKLAYLFLDDYPWAQEWLVRHGFAIEVAEFKPFNLYVGSKKEAALLWHRLNMSDSCFKTHYANEVQILGIDSEHLPESFELWKQVDLRI